MFRNVISLTVCYLHVRELAHAFIHVHQMVNISGFLGTEFVTVYSLAMYLVNYQILLHSVMIFSFIMEIVFTWTYYRGRGG